MSGPDDVGSNAKNQTLKKNSGQEIFENIFFYKLDQNLAYQFLVSLKQLITKFVDNLLYRRVNKKNHNYKIRGYVNIQGVYIYYQNN